MVCCCWGGRDVISFVWVRAMARVSTSDCMQSEYLLSACSSVFTHPCTHTISILHLPSNDHSQSMTLLGSNWYIVLAQNQGLRFDRVIVFIGGSGMVVDKESESHWEVVVEPHWWRKVCTRHIILHIHKLTSLWICGGHLHWHWVPSLQHGFAHHRVKSSVDLEVLHDWKSGLKKR